MTRERVDPTMWDSLNPSLTALRRRMLCELFDSLIPVVLGISGVGLPVQNRELWALCLPHHISQVMRRANPSRTPS